MDFFPQTYALPSDANPNYRIAARFGGAQIEGLTATQYYIVIPKANMGSGTGLHDLCFSDTPQVSVSTYKFVETFLLALKYTHLGSRVPLSDVSAADGSRMRCNSYRIIKEKVPVGAAPKVINDTTPPQDIEVEDIEHGIHEENEDMETPVLSDDEYADIGPLFEDEAVAEEVVEEVNDEDDYEDDEEEEDEADEEEEDAPRRKRHKPNPKHAPSDGPKLIEKQFISGALFMPEGSTTLHEKYRMFVEPLLSNLDVDDDTPLNNVFKNTVGILITVRVFDPHFSLEDALALAVQHANTSDNKVLGRRLNNMPKQPPMGSTNSTYTDLNWSMRQWYMQVLHSLPGEVTHGEEGLSLAHMKSESVLLEIMKNLGVCAQQQVHRLGDGYYTFPVPLLSVPYPMDVDPKRYFYPFMTEMSVFSSPTAPLRKYKDLGQIRYDNDLLVIISGDHTREQTIGTTGVMASDVPMIIAQGDIFRPLFTAIRDKRHSLYSRINHLREKCYDERLGESLIYHDMRVNKDVYVREHTYGYLLHTDAYLHFAAGYELSLHTAPDEATKAARQKEYGTFMATYNIPAGVNRSLEVDAVFIKKYKSLFTALRQDRRRMWEEKMKDHIPTPNERELIECETQMREMEEEYTNLEANAFTQLFISLTSHEKMSRTSIVVMNWINQCIKQHGTLYMDRYPISADLTPYGNMMARTLLEINTIPVRNLHSCAIIIMHKFGALFAPVQEKTNLMFVSKPGSGKSALFILCCALGIPNFVDPVTSSSDRADDYSDTVKCYDQLEIQQEGQRRYVGSRKEQKDLDSYTSGLTMLTEGVTSRRTTVRDPRTEKITTVEKKRMSNKSIILASNTEPQDPAMADRFEIYILSGIVGNGARNGVGLALRSLVEAVNTRPVGEYFKRKQALSNLACFFMTIGLLPVPGPEMIEKLYVPLTICFERLKITGATRLRGSTANKSRNIQDMIAYSVEMAFFSPLSKYHKFITDDNGETKIVFEPFKLEHIMDVLGYLTPNEEVAASAILSTMSGTVDNKDKENARKLAANARFIVSHVADWILYIDDVKVATSTNRERVENRIKSSDPTWNFYTRSSVIVRTPQHYQVSNNRRNYRVEDFDKRTYAALFTSSKWTEALNEMVADNRPRTNFQDHRNMSVDVAQLARPALYPTRPAERRRQGLYNVPLELMHDGTPTAELCPVFMEADNAGVPMRNINYVLVESSPTVIAKMLFDNDRGGQQAKDLAHSYLEKMCSTVMYLPQYANVATEAMPTSYYKLALMLHPDNLTDSKEVPVMVKSHRVAGGTTKYYINVVYLMTGDGDIAHDTLMRILSNRYSHKRKIVTGTIMEESVTAYRTSDVERSDKPFHTVNIDHMQKKVRDVLTQQEFTGGMYSFPPAADDPIVTYTGNLEEELGEIFAVKNRLKDPKYYLPINVARRIHEKMTTDPNYARFRSKYEDFRYPRDAMHVNGETEKANEIIADYYLREFQH